jgi:hypothetical protein
LWGWGDCMTSISFKKDERLAVMFALGDFMANINHDEKNTKYTPAARRAFQKVYDG